MEASAQDKRPVQRATGGAGSASGSGKEAKARFHCRRKHDSPEVGQAVLRVPSV